MKRFRLIIPLTIVFVLVLLAINWSKVAATNSAATTTKPSQNVLPTEDPGSIEVQSYTREYGVTPAEAIRRFRLLREVSTLNHELSANESGIFGGLWVQHVPEFKIIVNVTANRRQTIQQYIKGGPLERITDIQEVDLTLDELEALAASAREEISRANIPFEYDINIPENRVEIYVRNSVMKSN